MRGNTALQWHGRKGHNQEAIRSHRPLQYDSKVCQKANYNLEQFFWGRSYLTTSLNCVYLLIEVAIMTDIKKTTGKRYTDHKSNRRALWSLPSWYSFKATHDSSTERKMKKNPRKWTWSLRSTRGSQISFAIQRYGMIQHKTFPLRTRWNVGPHNVWVNKKC